MEAKHPSSSAVHVVRPPEGRAVRMPESRLKFTRKVSSEQTSGAFSLFEVAVEPKGGSTPHVQHREDECFYVLEGRFEFLIEDAKIEASAGSLIYVPKGNLHAFKNIEQTSGRLLVSQTPGGLHERFIEEEGERASGEEAISPTTHKSPEPGRLAAIGVEYGLEIVPSSAP